MFDLTLGVGWLRVAEQSPNISRVPPAAVRMKKWIAVGDN
jgi:hypothetical protein